MVTQTAYGAISVVNSLPSLLGSSAAINLKVNVVVSKSKNISLNGKPINDAFISTIVKHALEKCNGIGVSIDLKSEIPIASGLKSSSAVANALYKAICDEYNYKLELIEVAKITSKIAKKEGFSVTGAFDDSTSSLLGGITFTDNENFELIRRDVIDNDKYDVIICIPPYEKKNPFQYLGIMKKFRDVYREIFSIALSKKYWVALNINGIIINYIFGYKDELIKIAINNGALAAGVSGNGPSVVSVISEGEGGKIIDDWGKNECKVILTRFRGD